MLIRLEQYYILCISRFLSPLYFFMPKQKRTLRALSKGILDLPYALNYNVLVYVLLEFREHKKYNFYHYIQT